MLEGIFIGIALLMAMYVFMWVFAEALGMCPWCGEILPRHLPTCRKVR